MSRRDTVLVLAAALVIALLAWFFFARERSDAPTAPPPPGAMAGEPPLPGGRIYFFAGRGVHAVRADGDELEAIIDGRVGRAADQGELRLVSVGGRPDGLVLDVARWTFVTT